MKSLCVFIVGATATGKTDIAFELATLFKTEIISADSKQCFKELNIGVAKPSIEYLQQIPHHFINSHSIKDHISVATFYHYATEKIRQISNRIIFIVGGTGFYIDALLYGLNEIPDIPADLRTHINNKISEPHGVQWLQNEVQKYDPDFFKQTDIRNKHRLQRALEVFLSTKKSISTFKQEKKTNNLFTPLIFGINLNKKNLYHKINTRVDLMIQQNLLEEVKTIRQKIDLKQKRIIGYSEFENYFNHQISFEEAVDNIKRNTRHYAKRQFTWFKKNKNILWFEDKQKTEMIKAIGHIININL